MSVDSTPSSRRSPVERLRESTAAMLAADRERPSGQQDAAAALAGRGVSVTGAVRRPVAFLWDEGATAADAIAIARGLRPEAKRVIVVRRCHGAEVAELDVEIESASSVRLRPGDEVRAVH